MRYLLDTNVCVVYVNGRSRAVRQRLQAADLEEVAVCSVVKTELFYGAMRSNNPARTLQRQQRFLQIFESLPFDDLSAEIAARIRAQLAVSGTPIGSNDLLIAAIALANNLMIVTHNTREFSRVPGLRIDDWEVDG